MKKIQLGVWLIFTVCMLAGCTNYEKDYTENTLIVKRSGALVEVAVEDFNQSSVKAEDLAAYIEGQILDYNSGTEIKDAIRQKSINTEDMSKVKLVLAYKDMESYNGFNLLECVLDDFSNVKEERLEGTFTSIEGESVKKEDLQDVNKAKVLIFSEASVVVVKGSILYYNEEVSIKDDVAVTTGKGDAVIIFK
ncbi:MAG: hypothetical protein NC300_01640 [Bacteroidales bacterium]|nr:hypothetical protein [Clostridium sp.]MCM1202828.1 hypothetical protein [Bacteroidales bacterium]